MKRKQVWIKLIFFLIVFFLFSFNLITYDNLKYKFKINYQGENLLKSSDTEISIITPENKTYTKPMSGYYPATYGFEEDQIGTSGTDITFIDSKEAGAVATIVAEADNHKNILHYSTPSDFEAIWDDLSDNQSTGTIEFWINCAETNERHNLIVRGPMGNRILFDFYSNGMIQYLNYSVWHPIWPYEENRWYHVKIAFDCDIYGDGTNDWHLWIDGMNMDGGVGYGYDGAPMTMNQVIFQGTSGADFDIDAVGYSWDPKYNIGDNFNEGLLLSFENSTTLDWIGYSLDGQANKTILGNTTLPLPAIGTHNIQVFGNDSLGAMYASNLRYFTLDFPMINIITPENITYTKPMGGYYPATYGFENEFNGVEPTEWLRWDPSIGTVSVISEKVGHKKVLEINDDASPTGDDPGIYQLFSEDHNSGLIELWVYKESGNCPIWISLLDTNLTRYITVLGIDSYVSQYNNNRFNINSAPIGWQTFGPTFYDDQWYHISISWNGATKTVDVYINGILEAGNYSYTHTDAMDADRLEIRSAWGTTGLFYLDAIGCSWDPYYHIGDNLHEGLLLSIDNMTTLDWMGYSLDGQPIKTILGNTTIPFPTNGAHNIQVFGNDSLGIYVSEIQHFSINSSPAYIPPDNSLIIILSVAIGVFIAVFGIVLAVILTRKKRYEADKFKEPKKPEIRFKPKFEYLICPYCHNENLIKNNYCINCGASLSEFKPDNT